MAGYDYAGDGWYFVTISVKNTGFAFGRIEDGRMVLNKWGDIVAEKWQWLATQYKYVLLDEYIVMPDHFHGIIAISTSRRDMSRLVLERCNAEGENLNNSSDKSRHVRTIVQMKALSQLIGAFKTVSSKKIHLEGEVEFVWHRSFHDRIIRNEKELQAIRQYIHNNPANWLADMTEKFYE